MTTSTANRSSTGWLFICLAPRLRRAVELALKRTASDYEGQYVTEVANFVKNNFYVDDGLKSVSTPEAAVSLIKKTKSLCQNGGFNLHKFISNHKAVIGTIPHEDRSKDLQTLNTTKDILLNTLSQKYRRSVIAKISQINYLPQPSASANNRSARHCQITIFCSTSSNNC